MILPAQYGYDAYEALVSESAFRDGEPINLAALTAMPFETTGTFLPYLSDFPLLNEFEASLRQLPFNDSNDRWERLDNNQCRHRYSQPVYSGFRHVVIFVNTSSEDHNAGFGVAALSGLNYGTQQLVDLCPLPFLKTAPKYSVPKEFLLADPSSAPKGSGLCWQYSADAWNWEGEQNVNEWTWNSTNDVHISWCLSEKMPETCQILCSLLLLKIAAICIIAQAACMLLTIATTMENPIAIIGDAVASFLQKPVAESKNQCLRTRCWGPSLGWYTEQKRTLDPTSPPVQWNRKNRWEWSDSKDSKDSEDSKDMRKRRNMVLITAYVILSLIFALGLIASITYGAIARHRPGLIGVETQ